MEELIRLAVAPDPLLPWQTVALALLTAFVLSMVVAQVYVLTHRGLSYSRSFVQTLVLGAIVSATLMVAIGNNLARGIGILGTLAIIRFRATVKDPRDMVFVFASLSLGIAAGVRSFTAAFVGTAVFAAAAALLATTAFGSRSRFDGLVRFQLANDPENDVRLRALFGRHCRRWVLVTLREAGQGHHAEYNYHVKLLDPDLQALFVQELTELPGVRDVSYYLHQASEEI